MNNETITVQLNNKYQNGCTVSCYYAAIGHFLTQEIKCLPAVKLYKNGKSPLNAFAICFINALCKRSLKSLINVNLFLRFILLSVHLKVATEIVKKENKSGVKRERKNQS